LELRRVAAGSPYTVDVSRSDDATCEFTLDWSLTDGTVFPFSDYRIEYTITRNGSPVFSAASGDGSNNVLGQDGRVIFSAGVLPVATYQHGCRLVHLSSGKKIQVFTGRVTIGEGSFS
jgi:hypothetical protein